MGQCCFLHYRIVRRCLTSSSASVGPFRFLALARDNSCGSLYSTRDRCAGTTKCLSICSRSSCDSCGHGRGIVHRRNTMEEVEGWRTHEAYCLTPMPDGWPSIRSKALSSDTQPKAVREHRSFSSTIEDECHWRTRVNQYPVELTSFHQPSIRPLPRP